MTAPYIVERGRNRLVLTDLPSGLSIKMDFGGAGLAMIETDHETLMQLAAVFFAAARRTKPKR